MKYPVTLLIIAICTLIAASKEIEINPILFVNQQGLLPNQRMPIVIPGKKISSNGILTLHRKSSFGKWRHLKKWDISDLNPGDPKSPYRNGESFMDLSSGRPLKIDARLLKPGHKYQFSVYASHAAFRFGWRKFKKEFEVLKSIINITSLACTDSRY